MLFTDTAKKGKLLVYTRKPEEGAYGPGLAHSVHLAYSRDGSYFTPLNRNYGVLFASAAIRQPDTLVPVSYTHLKEFDTVICGGGAALLVEELNRTGFDAILQQAVEDGLLYVGISAGSMAAAGNFAAGLHFIENPLTIHCEQGTACGEIKGDGHIRLTDEQALWIDCLLYTSCGSAAEGV